MANYPVAVPTSNTILAIEAEKPLLMLENGILYPNVVSKQIQVSVLPEEKQAAAKTPELAHAVDMSVLVLI